MGKVIPQSFGYIGVCSSESKSLKFGSFAHSYVPAGASRCACAELAWWMMAVQLPHDADESDNATI
jgi:hypothetical protein